MRMEYAAYRDKYFSLPAEERNGRAMNMQTFIWSKIPCSSGPYQYDSDDPRDMKMKEIFERHNYFVGNLGSKVRKILDDNNQEPMDEVSTTSSDNSLDESEQINIYDNNPNHLDKLVHCRYTVVL